MSQASNIIVVGTGALGSALVRGIARDAELQQRLRLFDVDTARAAAVAEATGTRVASEAELGSPARALLIVVKPHDVAAALGALQQTIDPLTLVISCAAGVPIARVAAATGHARVVRVMPNVAAQVSSSATALVPGEGADSDDLALVDRLFGRVGSVHPFSSEEALHAVTSLAAGGPAFLATLVEGLADGGVRAGLTRDRALRLTREMIEGTMQLLESGIEPASLRVMVTSPAGTTAEGLAVLERQAVRAALADAVVAAAERSRELARGG